MTGQRAIFEVPRLNALGSRLLARHGGLLRRLGDIETRVLRERLDAVDGSRPIYVCGLARSGTTILLELLSRHPDTASHQYLDYPFVFTPYAWNRYLALAGRREEAPRERAHRDGLKVSPASPEAMEEPIWMRFFPGAHDPSTSSILTATTRNAEFEGFYAAHIAKMLLARGGTRYLAKGNYHLARMGYLAALYPRARFIVPVRDPVTAIASSIKQHRLFEKGQAENPAARRYLRQVGHFEFGRDRAPINVEPERTRQVIARWAGGDEIGGWALYWAAIHTYLAELLRADSDLRDRILIVPYESFCAEPAAVSETVLDFCDLSGAHDVKAFAESEVGFPTYYEHRFTDREVARIRTETADAARLLRDVARVELAWIEAGACSTLSTAPATLAATGSGA